MKRVELLRKLQVCVANRVAVDDDGKVFFVDDKRHVVLLSVQDFCFAVIDGIRRGGIDTVVNFDADRFLVGSAASDFKADAFVCRGQDDVGGFFRRAYLAGIGTVRLNPETDGYARIFGKKALDI